MFNLCYEGRYLYFPASKVQHVDIETSNIRIFSSETRTLSRYKSLGEFVCGGFVLESPPFAYNGHSIFKTCCYFNLKFIINKLTLE